MIGIRIPTHAPVEHARGVGVLLDWAEVENPKILPVTMFKEFLHVFSAIAIESFHA
jgi:hypothetical protein